MKLFPFKIVNKDGKPYILVKIKDGEVKVFSPEEISAMILTKMKETAEAFLGNKIKDAVVTVPAYFNGHTSLADNDSSSVSAMASLRLKNPQEIWSLAENSKLLLQALKLFFTKREKEIGHVCFDKDDQLAVEFVTAAANIWATSFKIPMHTLFEAKGMAGNIIYAVATTNAIIAGLIVIDAIKVLQNDVENYRFMREICSRRIVTIPKIWYGKKKTFHVMR